MKWNEPIGRIERPRGSRRVKEMARVARYGWLMTSLWEPEGNSELVIGRLRSANVAKARGKASGRIGPRDVARMLLAGLFLGGLFLAGTLGLPRLTSQRPNPAIEQRRPVNADPYAEARLSRQILDRQAGAPEPAALHHRRGTGGAGAPPTP